MLSLYLDLQTNQEGRPQHGAFLRKVFAEHGRSFRGEQRASYDADVKRYETEKNEIRAQAEGHQKRYSSLNLHDDQFDLSDAALSVSIALLGITALTKKKWLLVFAIAFMAFGMFFGIAGFLQWEIHPDVLTELLG